MTYIDLSQRFTASMPVYPGDPAAGFKPWARFEKDGFNDQILTTGLHVGTHIDAPFHQIADGAKLDEIPLERFTGQGKIIDARGRTDLDVELISNQLIEPGDFVFFFTDWAQYWDQPKYFEQYPLMSEALAELLVVKGVGCIGTDTPSPDQAPFKVHKILLGNQVLIIENLTNLSALLEADSFTIVAFPFKIAADAAPVRVVAEIK